MSWRRSKNDGNEVEGGWRVLGRNAWKILPDGVVDTLALAASALTGAKVAAGTLDDTHIASANKDGANSTPSLRTLGSTTGKAADGAIIGPSPQGTDATVRDRLDRIEASLPGPVGPAGTNGEIHIPFGPANATDAMVGGTYFRQVPLADGYTFLGAAISLALAGSAGSVYDIERCPDLTAIPQVWETIFADADRPQPGANAVYAASGPVRGDRNTVIAKAGIRGKVISAPSDSGTVTWLTPQTASTGTSTATTLTLPHPLDSGGQPADGTTIYCLVCCSGTTPVTLTLTGTNWIDAFTASATTATAYASDAVTSHYISVFVLKRVWHTGDADQAVTFNATGGGAVSSTATAFCATSTTLDTSASNQVSHPTTDTNTATVQTPTVTTTTPNAILVHFVGLRTNASTGTPSHGGTSGSTFAWVAPLNTTPDSSIETVRANAANHSITIAHETQVTAGGNGGALRTLNWVNNCYSVVGTLVFNSASVAPKGGVLVLRMRKT